jgi:hypothetical protein
VLPCAADPDCFHGTSKGRLGDSSKRNWCSDRAGYDQLNGLQ